MSVEIHVGPPVLTINRSGTFVVTEHDGTISRQAAQGVFSDDTRFVSEYRLLINGQPWQRLTTASVTYHSALLILGNPDVREAGVRSGQGQLKRGRVQLALARFAEPNRIRELFRVTNYAQRRIGIMLELELRSDFSDLFEVRAGELRDRYNLTTEWSTERGELTTTYQSDSFFRRFVYRIASLDQSPSHADGRIRFPIHLEAGASWEATADMLLESHAPGEGLKKEAPPSLRDITAHHDELQQQWVDSCTRLSTTCRELRRAYQKSIEDMGSLRLLEQDLRSEAWVPAGGIPWYVALFGRDTLVASYQNMPVHARFADGALRTLAQHQAKSRDDWRDAQPGKIVHEIRHGELSELNLRPHSAYYGTWDATPLFLIVLGEAWRWLADRKLIEDLREAAESCLTWIDEHGDLDGDGFQEYRTFSSKGYENMSWKDAHDSVVYPDGTPVKQPKALCELQGYVYAAKRAMAEVFAALGELDRARELERQAAELKRRFNEAFWMEDEGTYAFALDPEKKQVPTVVSNPGHCLWTGIADVDKAARVAKRLLEPDMWSGWGVRTLSAKHRCYDPSSYQRGSVWPHDNGIVAAGLKRYGFVAEANQIARGLLDAAEIFERGQLPEVFAGVDREVSPFPVQYLGANIPQAWAAGSIFHLVRTILGLRADAPNGRLWVDPTLPDWLPTIELANLKVGGGTLHLRFWRDGPNSRFSVESRSGDHIDVELEAKTTQRFEEGSQCEP